MRRLCVTLLSLTLCAMPFACAFASSNGVSAVEFPSETILQSSAGSFEATVDGIVEDVVASIGGVVEEVSVLSFWKRFLVRLRKISGAAFILLMFSMLTLSWLDSRHPRRMSYNPPVTVVVPCYNDASSIQDTIASVFKAYPAELVELIVINDKSTDDSLALISAMQDRHSFRIVDNKDNMGKALSLNAVIPQAKHDFVLCLDADTILNRNSIQDMLSRMLSDDRVGAVSSPYRPRNRGFLALMQAIEYNMVMFSQGAYNVTSVMALWGGCMMVRKCAFESVGGFRLDAITEDVDMAYRLIRRKWRVQQSFRPVRSIVPSTFQGWVKQKLRWTSGGTQCYFRHFKVWIRNPIRLFFLLSYGFFIASSVLDFFDGIDPGGCAGAMWNDDLGVMRNLANLNSALGSALVHRFRSMTLCCALSCIYVLPLVRRVWDVLKLLLVIPFSMFYFPMYIFVSFFGTPIGIRSMLFPRASDTRAWDTGPTDVRRGSGS